MTNVITNFRHNEILQERLNNLCVKLMGFKDLKSDYYTINIRKHDISLKIDNVNFDIMKSHIYKDENPEGNEVYVVVHSQIWQSNEGEAISEVLEAKIFDDIVDAWDYAEDDFLEEVKDEYSN